MAKITGVPKCQSRENACEVGKEKKKGEVGFQRVIKDLTSKLHEVNLQLDKERVKNAEHWRFRDEN